MGTGACSCTKPNFLDHVHTYNTKQLCEVETPVNKKSNAIHYLVLEMKIISRKPLSNFIRERKQLRVYLVPRMSLNLRKSKIRIIWIHASNFFPSRSTKNLTHT